MKPRRVLIACEFRGTVRDAFLARGHDAWSCDLLADERGSNRHIRCDVRELLKRRSVPLMHMAFTSHIKMYLL